MKRYNIRVYALIIHEGKILLTDELRMETRMTKFPGGAERELVIGEILLIHAREGIIDPATKRISEEHYRPVGRLFGNRYCTTRQRFDLPGALPGPCATE